MNLCLMNESATSLDAMMPGAFPPPYVLFLICAVKSGECRAFACQQPTDRQSMARAVGEHVIVDQAFRVEDLAGCGIAVIFCVCAQAGGGADGAGRFDVVHGRYFLGCGLLLLTYT